MPDYNDELSDYEPTAIELPTCPFCNVIPEVNWHTIGPGPQVEIITCFYKSCPMYKVEFTRNEWLHRPIEDFLRSRVAKLTAELAALRAQTAWIACADRLPENGHRVIAFSGYWHDHKAIDAANFYLRNGEPWWQFDEYTSTGSVTHWMPLPHHPPA